MKCSFHIVFVTFCSWALMHEERKHDVIMPENMEFDVVIRGTPIEVFCKFEMFISKRVLVIKEYVRFAFLFVQAVV